MAEAEDSVAACRAHSIEVGADAEHVRPFLRGHRIVDNDSDRAIAQETTQASNIQLPT
jgi:hypothetical protein